ncbi:MAG: hypothetical protein QM676_11750 [Novosphingobium sp.]
MKRLYPGGLLAAGVLIGIGLAADGATLMAQPAMAQPANAQPTPAAIAAPALEGRWEGAFGQKADKLVVVEIRRDAGGRVGGSVTGVDENRSVFAIDAVERNGSTVRLVVGEAGGGFEGQLSGDGTTLTGHWSELAITTPLELVRVPAGK